MYREPADAIVELKSRAGLVKLHCLLFSSSRAFVGCQSSTAPPWLRLTNGLFTAGDRVMNILDGFTSRTAQVRHEEFRSVHRASSSFVNYMQPEVLETLILPGLPAE